MEPALYSRKHTLGWGIKLDSIKLGEAGKVSFSYILISGEPLESEVNL